MGTRRNQAHIAVHVPTALVVSPDDHETGEFALRAGIGLKGNPSKTSRHSQIRLQLRQHCPRARSLFSRAERMQLRKGRPSDRDELRRSIQLHRARTERNHRMHQRQVLVFEALDVAHHLRLGVVAVEDRVVQVIDLTPKLTEERAFNADAGNRAHAKNGAQRRQVRIRHTFVDGHPDVDAIWVVTQVEFVGLRTGLEAPHGVLAALHPNGQGVKVGGVDLGIGVRVLQRRVEGAGIAVNPLGNRTESMRAVVDRVH